MQYSTVHYMHTLHERMHARYLCELTSVAHNLSMNPCKLKSELVDFSAVTFDLTV